MEINEAQKVIKEIYGERDKERGLWKNIVWLGEEVGELFKAVRENKGIGEEVADVFAWLLSISNLLNIDVEEEFKKKYCERE